MSSQNGPNLLRSNRTTTQANDIDDIYRRELSSIYTPELASEHWGVRYGGAHRASLSDPAATQGPTQGAPSRPELLAKAARDAFERPKSIEELEGPT